MGELSRSRPRGRASWPWRAGPTSASPPWPTRSSGPRWRSSPTSPRPRGGPSAGWPRARTGSSSSSTCPACSALATRSPSACSTGSSGSWPTPTPAFSWSTASRGSVRETASWPSCSVARARAGEARRSRLRSPPTRSIGPASHGSRPRCRPPRSSTWPRTSTPSRPGREPVYRRSPIIWSVCCPRDRSTSRRLSDSDQEPLVVLAELVREQVLARTREEVPHAVEVEVQEIRHPRADLVLIEAVVLLRDRIAEGNPDRRRRPDDQVDRRGRPAGDRARAGHEGASGALGAGPAALAGR